MKFEDNIKEQLEKRRLKPSKEAWGRIERELEIASSNRKKKNVYVWWVAASVVGILLVVAGLLMPQEKERQIQLVDTQVPVQKEELQILEPNNKNVESQQQIVEATQEGKSEDLILNTKSESEKHIVISNGNAPIEMEDKTALGIAEESDAQKHNRTDYSSKATDDPLQEEISSKVGELVAQVDKMQQQKLEVTDEEIDALLAQAQQEIIRNRIYNEQTNQVDATALLIDVEAELDESFRDRVFEALKDGFHKAREAIASRND